jgi:hypothetical protein
MRLDRFISPFDHGSTPDTIHFCPNRESLPIDLRRSQASAGLVRQGYDQQILERPIEAAVFAGDGQA